MAFHGTSKTHLFNDPKITFKTESKVLGKHSILKIALDKIKFIHSVMRSIRCLSSELLPLLRLLLVVLFFSAQVCCLTYPKTGEY